MSLSGGLCFSRVFLFESNEVQSGKSHAAAIFKPNDNTVSLGIDIGVVGSGDAVAVPAAGHNEKRFERSCIQMLTYVSDHLRQLTSATQGPQAGIRLG